MEGISAAFYFRRNADNRRRVELGAARTRLQPDLVRLPSRVPSPWEGSGWDRGKERMGAASTKETSRSPLCGKIRETAHERSPRPLLSRTRRDLPRGCRAVGAAGRGHTESGAVPPLSSGAKPPVTSTSIAWCPLACSLPRSKCRT
jgi:hypothetical protein